MSWPGRIEKLRQYVMWECNDVPPDLILGVINNESGGIVGRMGERKIKTPGVIRSTTGNPKWVEIAYGLTQAIPSTIEFYNQNQKNKRNIAYYEDVSGKTERAARIQIRIGCFTLAWLNAYFHRRYPRAFPAASLSQAKRVQVDMILAAYLMGHAALQKKLDALIDKGHGLSMANIKRVFPHWGQSKNEKGEWITHNRPFLYAQKVGDSYQDNRGKSYAGGSPSTMIAKAARKAGGGGVIIAFVLAALWAWKTNKGQGASNASA